MCKHIGLCVNGGISYLPKRGTIKVDDNCELNKSNGGFFKIGIKGIYSHKNAVYWNKLFYIGSFYHEIGMQYRNNVYTPFEASGFVSGVGVVFGLDLKLYKRLFFRGGLQYGYYRRTDHLGLGFLTDQPGFGFEAFVFDEQLIIGLIYAF